MERYRSISCDTDSRIQALEDLKLKLLGEIRKDLYDKKGSK